MPGVYDTPTWQRVDPRLQAAFLAMQAEAPGRVELGNGWRSNDQQRRLFAQKPGLAAEPGKSNHEFGLALDITYENSAVRQWVHKNARRFGLWFPMDYEPWHIQLIGVDRHNIRGGAQIGGGRDAFSTAPDGRFVNPYDAMAGYMDMEDDTNPLTQFERLISAITSTPDALAGAPPEVGAMGAPILEGGGDMDIGQAAGQVMSDLQTETNITGPEDVPITTTGGRL